MGSSSGNFEWKKNKTDVKKLEAAYYLKQRGFEEDYYIIDLRSQFTFSVFPIVNSDVQDNVWLLEINDHPRWINRHASVSTVFEFCNRKSSIKCFF